MENAARTILVTGVDLAAAAASPQQPESALGSIGVRRPARMTKQLLKPLLFASSSQQLLESYTAHFYIQTMSNAADTDFDQLTRSLTESFNVLADEVQLLSDRKTVLEHKLRFAHEQVRYNFILSFPLLL